MLRYSEHGNATRTEMIGYLTEEEWNVNLESPDRPKKIQIRHELSGANDIRRYYDASGDSVFSLLVLSGFCASESDAISSKNCLSSAANSGMWG